MNTTQQMREAPCAKQRLSRIKQLGVAMTGMTVAVAIAFLARQPVKNWINVTKRTHDITGMLSGLSEAGNMPQNEAQWFEALLPVILLNE